MKEIRCLQSEVVKLQLWVFKSLLHVNNHKIRSVRYLNILQVNLYFWLYIHQLQNVLRISIIKVFLKWSFNDLWLSLTLWTSDILILQFWGLHILFPIIHGFPNQKIWLHSCSYATSLLSFRSTVMTLRKLVFHAFICQLRSVICHSDYF